MRSTSTKRIIVLSVAAYLVATVAMMVKGTEIIFVIALTLTMVMTALLKRRYWLIALSCVLFMLSHVLSSLSVIIVEMATGQDFGEGLPQLSWIAIGLDAGSTTPNQAGGQAAPSTRTSRREATRPHNRQLQCKASLIR